MSNRKVLVRVADFTLLPGARYVSDGEGSAEQFFDDFIVDKIKEPNNTSLMIDLDGTAGYASSFVSELAVRICKAFGRRYAKKNVEITSNEDPIQKIIFRNSIEKYR